MRHTKPMTAVMCDWVTASIIRPQRPAGSKIFDTGAFINIDPEGSILKQFAGRIFHEGSFDNKVAFRAPTPNQLEMSGNPVKFLQGHNLFGSGDFLGLFLDTGFRARRQGAQFPGPETFISNQFPEPRFTRLDLTRNYKFSNDNEARAWLRNTAAKGHAKSGSPLLAQDTVYYGKTSTRWSFKMYLKSDEINSKKKGHELSNKINVKDQILLRDWSEGVVRFELTLRRPELEKLPISFDLLEVWQNYFKRVTFNKNGEVFDMSMIEELKLTSAKKTALMSWSMGVDLRQIYPERSFYRIRRELLDVTGFDISETFGVDDLAPLRVALRNENWDPKPIEHLFYTPNEKLKTAYGLK